MKPAIAIGIDLGGTNLKVAAVERSGAVRAKRTEDANVAAGPETVIAHIAEMVDAVLADASLCRSDMVGVGVGAPGPLSHRTGRIIRSANLPGWVDVPIRDLLARRLEVSVALDNDGNAAAFGEFWAGVGREGEDLCMLTLGTGVGAGVIISGCVFHGHFENAAEVGHMIVVADGIPCPCGQRGCLEQYASAAGVARRVEAAAGGRAEPNAPVASAPRGGRSSPVAKGEAAGRALPAINEERRAEPDLPESPLAKGVGEQLNAQIVADRAQQGDALCLRIWDEACLYLAIACINIQHLYNPARVVLGGGLAQAGAFLVDRVKEQVRRRTWKMHNDVPDIVLAQLGYDAGVIGAAGLAWRASEAANPHQTPLAKGRSGGVSSRA